MVKVDDGFNDVVLMTNDKSRYQLAKLSIQMDNGDYFNKKDGTIYPNLGIEYFKTSQWVLKPTRKGPVP